MNRSTLREQVYMTLRSEILDGRLTAGTRLAEVDLASQLGVSRGTVREALRRLQQSGLVEGEDRAGLRVTEFSHRQIVELYDVRGALEALAAASIVREGRGREVADQLEQHLPELPAGTSVEERLDVDLAFHERLCEASGNVMLLTMWRDLQDLMRVAVLSHAAGTKTGLMAPSFHMPIVEGLRSGDPEVVQQILIGHMTHAARVWANR
ncbi:GntR family transcriptional regulator [Schaalia sp. ZJ1691]|uniref:GntR family transcriptional regulator n=1 Tax=Schaalia sp. ZJ1691 TaxID=2709404 RepID=UPI0013EB8EF7|nr:GntR family transcriptional regulator [Schaalia sp. ZJ1691]